MLISKCVTATSTSPTKSHNRLQAKTYNKLSGKPAEKDSVTNTIIFVLPILGSGKGAALIEDLTGDFFHSTSRLEIPHPNNEQCLHSGVTVSIL